MSTDPDEDMLARLAAIENHVHQIAAQLGGTIGEFNGRLEEIHATLDAVIGFVTPGQINESFTGPSAHVERSITPTKFQVVARVSRDGGGARLASDVSWPDIWSVRLFVTALLRNLSRNDHNQERRQCWCEVWTPDETGQCIDSAILNPDTGTIEWESDIARESGPVSQ